jgi:hypothetical protein
MGISACALEDDQVALGNSSFKLGSWRSAITGSSGICSRGAAGARGVSAGLSAAIGGSSGAAGTLAREEADLLAAIRESFLAIIAGAVDIRVGGVRAIRFGAGSVVSNGGKTETDIVSGRARGASLRKGYSMSNTRAWVARDRAKNRHAVVQSAISLYYRVTGREESEAARTFGR